MPDEPTPAAAPATPAEPAAPAAPVPAPAAKPLDDPNAFSRMAAEKAKAEAPAVESTETPAASEATPVAPATASAADKATLTEQAAVEAETKEVLADALANADEGKDLEQLQEYAKRLGYVVDDRKIYNQERKDFREHQRKQRASLAAEREAAINEIQQFRAQHEGTITVAQQAVAALKNGDLPEFAKLAGYKDWDDVQATVMKKLADPNYLEIQELKQALAAKEQREEAERQEYRRQQQVRAAGENKQRYYNRLSQEMAQSKEPICRELAGDPRFVQAIAAIQEQHWDPESKTTVKPEQAVKIAMGGRRAMVDEMKDMYDRLGKVFGGGQAAPVAATPAATPAPAAAPAAEKKPKTNKTQVVKGAPIAPSSNGDMDPKTFWGQHAKKVMLESFADDDKPPAA